MYFVKGPWGACSDSCSNSPRQKREVYCIVKIKGQAHVTNEMTCSAHLKPPEEQSCEGVCPPHWYMGEWGPCEGSCPTGVQKRRVTCLDIQGTISNKCFDENMPVTKRICVCNNKENTRDVDRYQPAQDQPIESKWKKGFCNGLFTYPREDLIKPCKDRYLRH